MRGQPFTTISIPKELGDKLKGKLEGTSFHSVSSYVTFILRQIVARSKENEEVNEEKVKKELKILGYI